MHSLMQESILIIKILYLARLPSYSRHPAAEGSVVEQLLAAGADPDRKTHDDFTALGFSLYQENT
jgi:ankyrin repeat protein